MENWGKILETELKWRDGILESLPFFFDVRKVILTLSKDSDDSADPQLSFINAAGETVHSCPYRGDESFSDVLSFLSAQVGVPAMRIGLLLKDIYVQPDGATTMDNIFAGVVSGSAVAPLASEEFIMEKAKAVMIQTAGHSWPSAPREEIPPWRLESNDSSFAARRRWLKLQELGLQSRLNSVLNFPEDSPCEIEQQWSTGDFYYAGGYFRAKFCAFLLSNGVLLLLREQEYVGGVPSLG